MFRFCQAEVCQRALPAIPLRVHAAEEAFISFGLEKHSSDVPEGTGPSDHQRHEKDMFGGVFGRETSMALPRGSAW